MEAADTDHVLKTSGVPAGFCVHVHSIDVRMASSNESTPHLALLFDAELWSYGFPFGVVMLMFLRGQKTLVVEEASDWLPAANGRPEQKL
jgi:hypothetical protein